MKITKDLIKKICSQTIYRRGMDYYAKGRVHLREASERVINAAVDGSSMYTVEIKLGDKGITDYMCTCPYQQTMGSVCKHIVAVLEQCRVEQKDNASATRGDKAALRLCSEYSSQNAVKEAVYPSFRISVNTTAAAGKAIMVSLRFYHTNRVVDTGENFLDAYINGKELRIDHALVYAPQRHELPAYHKRIIDVLAESYQASRMGMPNRVRSVLNSEITPRSLARIIKYLKYVDYCFIVDGTEIGRAQILEDENPDITVDVNTVGGDVIMNVSDRGFSLTPDGEWFLYENKICGTDAGWRSFFMPIYRALTDEQRSYIVFRKGNRLKFASEVLPYIKHRQGVVLQGLDEVIIEEKPRFDVYLELERKNLSAVIRVSHGSEYITLPMDDEFGSLLSMYNAQDLRFPGEKDNDVVLLRDIELERRLYSHFGSFQTGAQRYILRDDSAIYIFLTETLPRIRELAEVHVSDRLSRLFVTDSVNFKIYADYNRSVDLLEVGFDTNLSPQEAREILAELAQNKKFYRFKSGEFLDLSRWSGGELDVLSALNFTEDDVDAGLKRLPKYYALYLSSSGCVETRRGLSELIESARAKELKYPEHLDGVLRAYQKEGIAWLGQLSAMGMGGVLADDMGLGKTLQVIAYVMGERPKEPVLIVSPSALVYNWYNEIERFTPEARALIADGTKEERARLLKDVSGYDFVITSYPLLRRDESMYKDIHFSYCFIDEAQYIKNPKTLNARSVKNINAALKFALTGTPIENSLSELWSIFDFIMHGYLNSAAEFNNKYLLPIERDNDLDASAALRGRIKPFILRRMKKDVLKELPEKIENTVYAELVPEQKRLYAAFLQLAKRETSEILSMGGGEKMRILVLLMRLRQICCHPAIFDESYKKESGKLNLLMDLVQSAIGSGHRLLIFSQFTSMLDIIGERLDRAKIGYFRLDGSTRPAARTEMTERFNDGEREVFLISLKAGGTGLNLTGADMVIHYDPWWNPAAVDQASDRAYRIGQTRVVQVIKLAARGTIEEKILKLQANKRALADDIIKVNNESFASLSDEEILALFE